MFNHLFRTLSHVPRWPTLPVIRRQDVAQHSYYVTLYTAEIIGAVFPHWPAERQVAAIQYALVHDAPEARTGDQPGPVKRTIGNPEKAAAFEELVMHEMGRSNWVCPPEAKAVVKAADCIDETFFVAGEIAMGSGMMQNIWPEVTNRMKSACDMAGLPDEIPGHVIAECRKLMDYRLTWNNTDVGEKPRTIAEQGGIA